MGTCRWVGYTTCCQGPGPLSSRSCGLQTRMEHFTGEAAHFLFALSEANSLGRSCSRGCCLSSRALGPHSLGWDLDGRPGPHRPAPLLAVSSSFMAAKGPSSGFCMFAKGTSPQKHPGVRLALTHPCPGAWHPPQMPGVWYRPHSRASGQHIT